MIKQQRGLTLIEVITTIVILGITLVGAVNGITLLVSHSADPINRQQAIYIAQSYIEEILANPYADPSSGSVCATVPASRANYDDVCDYRNVNDAGARNQFDQAITGLENFNVNVDVTATTLDSDSALLVDVTVTYGTNQSVALSAYRMEY